MSRVQENIARFYSKLNELRVEEKYTDVTLQCESKSFKCHRLVLTVASTYFEAMFERNFKESSLQSIDLQEVSAANFEEVLQFIYTGDVDVNATNVYDLLRVSDYFSLPGIEDLCLKFVTNHKHQITTQNVFPLFLYTCNTKKDSFVNILSKLIAEHFSVCCKLEEFLEISFDHLQIILEQYSLLSSRNEESLLTAIIRWTCHKREERSQRLGKFLGTIQFDSISPAYCRLMTELIVAENPITALKRPTGCDMVSEFQKGKTLKIENNLHVYVKYKEENLIRIFSINTLNKCTSSGEILLTDKNVNIRCTVSDDLYLYCLNYIDEIEGPSQQNSEKQIFCAYPSVDRRMTITLSPPPVVFQTVSLCYLQNNIYAYDENVTRSSVVRSNSQSSKMFNDEEIERRIFVYNCSSDNWLPVAAMKNLLCQSCMTVCENTLYLIGGTESHNKNPKMSYAQAFDSRAGWRTLTASHNKFHRASCCALNGKIYVCGGGCSGKTAERYDPIANKWEIITSMDNEAIFHRMIQFDNKLWVMGSQCLDNQNSFSPSNNLSMNLYDVAVNKWSESSILEEAAATLIVKPTTILEGVVFSIL